MFPTLNLLVFYLCSFIRGFSPVRPVHMFGTTSFARARVESSLNGLFGNTAEDVKVIENIMSYKGMTFEEAEKDYNEYKQNPNDYALNKGQAYYESLGYKSLMEGVLGEADKQGTGDETRARIEAFKKTSQIKAFGFIGVTFGSFFGLKLYSESDPDGFARNFPFFM